MMEMFNLILKQKLSPNQFYLLYCLRENVGTLQINNHAELRALVVDGWITQSGDGIILQPKAITLLQQVESYFKVQKKKTSNQLMGEDFSENVEKYIELFPKIKLPSGKPARADKRNIETAFRWFFENHSYSWHSILEATSRYVHEYEAKRYMYMQTSQFFIRKQQLDKTWGSELANCCALVDSGQAEEEDTHFKENVV